MCDYQSPKVMILIIQRHFVVLFSLPSTLSYKIKVNNKPSIQKFPVTVLLGSNVHTDLHSVPLKFPICIDLWQTKRNIEQNTNIF